MEENLINKLNNYGNTYIAFAQSIANSNSTHGESFEKLLEFIAKNSKNNINDNIFTVHEEYDHIGSEFTKCYKVNMGSIIELLGITQYEHNWGWHTGKPKKIFDILEKAGLDFNKETNSWLIQEDRFDSFLRSVNSKEDFFNNIEEFSVKKIISDPVFGKLNDNEERNICLLGHSYNQMLPGDFEKRIIKNKTLHNAVASSNHKLIKFLIEDCKVNPNIKNQDLETPLFFCKDPSTLKLLNEYQLNWFSKNVLGKDCLSLFTVLSQKEYSKEMIEFAQKRMVETMADNKEEEVSPEYVKARIKQTLLEMVQADRTKKELEEFIKKNKVDSFSDIFDEEGNSLAQICLKKHNWARYEIFKKYYPLEHLNNKGMGSLEILFPIQRASYADRAKNILEELLNNNVQDKNSEFSFNLIKSHFKNSRSFDLPIWYFGNSSNKKGFFDFARELIPDEYARHFADNYKKKSQYSYSLNSYDTESENIKPIIYLLLTHASIHNKEADLSQLPIKEMFTENKSFYNERMDYQVDKVILYNFVSVIETVDENSHLKNFNYSKIWTEFEQSAVEHLIKSYHVNKEDGIKSFIEENKFLMEILLERKSELFKSIINNEFVQDMREEKELGVKLEYVLLTSQVREKEGKVNKSNKI